MENTADPGIDAEKLLAEYEDSNFLRSLLETFLNDGPKTLLRLQTAGESGDSKEALAAAHSIKNMVGLLRSQEGLDLAERVREAVLGKDPKEVGASIRALAETCRRLMDECVQLLDGPKLR